MQHPYATITGFVDEPLDGWRGPWGQNGYSLEFYPSEPARGFVRGTKWNLMPVGGHCSITTSWSVARSRRGGGLGVGFHRNLARTFGCGFTWGIQGDDLPDPANHISWTPRRPTRTAARRAHPLHPE